MDSDSDLWRRARALFERAIELPPEERVAFVMQATEDSAVRTEVQALLTADEAAQTRFLEGGAVADFGDEGWLPPQWIGRRFGAYEATSELGRGGMGVVLLGERVDGRYEAKVAIKVIQTTLMAEGLRERFRKEGQILAGLDHPNIARLYDAGDTPDGLSYLIMEYVDGPHLDVFADGRVLDVRARLQLFRGVLDGVDYAHARGVVHRDLKPSNILITQDGTPKLVDFGIAKLLEPSAGTGAERTRTALRMLTPEYASPEQVRSLPVEPASDVYSLGVVLYRLLTGRPPYDLDTTERAAAERIICEETPRRPSHAVTMPIATSGHPTDEPDTSPAVLAQNRGSTLDHLKRALRGDLDTIVLAALGKEPAMRYETAGAFADDIDRYLAGEPVRARTPSVVYRASRFARRKRVPLAVTGLLLLGAGAAAWQGRAAAIERGNAAANSEQLTTLAASIIQTFSGAQREEASTTETREAAVAAALSSLEQLVERIDGRPSPDLLYQLSAAYRQVAMVQGYPFGANLGKFEEAFANLSRAVALVREVTEDHPEYAAAHAALGQQVTLLGDMHLSRGQMDSAVVLYRESETILGERLTEDAEDLRALDGMAVVLQRLANVFAGMGDLDQSEGYLLRSLDQEKLYSALTTGDKVAAAQDVITVTGNVGVLRSMRGDFEGAVELDREALRVADSLAGTDLTVRIELIRASLNMQLAQHLLETPQRAEAGPPVEDALGILRSLVEADRANVQNRETLGTAYLTRSFLAWEEGRYEDAVRDAQAGLRELDDSRESRFVFVANSVSAGHRFWAEALTDLGDSEAALEHLQESIAFTRRALELTADSPSLLQWELAVVRQATARHYLVRAASEGASLCALANAEADSARVQWEANRERGLVNPGQQRQWDRYASRMPFGACE